MKGGQLNTKGQYGRTPLYRAAFGGHTNAVKVQCTRILLVYSITCKSINELIINCC